MKKQDLRIGIIMFDSVRQKEVTLELKHFKELEIAETNFFDRYKPVEITGEFADWVECSMFKLYAPGTGNDWGFVIPGKGIITTIQYKHQLQNLFHAITGNDLILILNKS